MSLLRRCWIVSNTNIESIKGILTRNTKKTEDNKTINIENNKTINTEKKKKTNCTYSLSDDTIRKLDELKYKYMPVRSKLNDIVELAISNLHAEKSNQTSQKS